MNRNNCLGLTMVHIILPWDEEVVLWVENEEKFITRLRTISSVEIMLKGHRTFLCAHNIDRLLFCASTIQNITDWRHRTFLCAHNIDGLLFCASTIQNITDGDTGRFCVLTT